MIFFRIKLHKLQGSYFISFLFFFFFPLGGSSGLHLSQSPGLGQNPMAALLSDLWKDAVDWSVFTRLLRSHCLQTGAVNLISVKNTRNGHFFFFLKSGLPGIVKGKQLIEFLKHKGSACLSHCFCFTFAIIYSPAAPSG